MVCYLMARMVSSRKPSLRGDPSPNSRNDYRCSQYALSPTAAVMTIIAVHKTHAFPEYPPFRCSANKEVIPASLLGNSQHCFWFWPPHVEDETRRK
jgi:hypothetical protein